MKLFQPSIFDAPSISYNRGVKKLEELAPRAARAALRQYQGFAPEKNLELEFALADILDDWALRDALESDPETAMDIWEQRVSDAGIFYPENGHENEVVSRVRKALFIKISQTLLNHHGPAPDDRFLTGGRAVKCLMLGGMWQSAFNLCRQVLSRCDRPGRILGYMGDCAYSTGMKDAARSAYLQACLVAPEEIETVTVCDDNIREFLTCPEYVCDEYDIPEGPWRENIHWAAAVGIVAGIFPVIPVKALYSVIKLEDILYSTSSREYAPGQAFAAGLILSFQGADADPGHDNRNARAGTADIRRTTREMAPVLFSMAINRLSDR